MYWTLSSFLLIWPDYSGGLSINPLILSKTSNSNILRGDWELMVCWPGNPHWRKDNTQAQHMCCLPFISHFQDISLGLSQLTGHGQDPLPLHAHLLPWKTWIKEIGLLIKYGCKWWGSFYQPDMVSSASNTCQPYVSVRQLPVISEEPRSIVEEKTKKPQQTKEPSGTIMVRHLCVGLHSSKGQEGRHSHLRIDTPKRKTGHAQSYL